MLSGWLGKLLLLAGSLAVVFGGFEAALRVAHRSTQGKERDERSTYMQPDAYLGWSKRPGARITYTRREYTVEVAINSRGLRDREREYGRVPGRFRILALGDSFIEAYSVPFEASLTAVLERTLTKQDCWVEVINAGTSGYSTDQEYLFYQREGVRYAPDVVVLFFHYNDLLHNVYERYYRLPKPLLDVSGPQIRQVNFPVPPPPPADPPRARKAAEGSLAWYWIRERLMVGAPRTFNLLARAGLWDPLGGDTPSEELHAYQKRRSQEMQYAWRVTDRILAGLAREVSSRGARLLVAYVPARMEVSDRDWDLSRLRYEMSEDRWDRRLVWQRLARSAESGGFQILDLTEGLRQAEGLFRPTYYPYDGHWTVRGHRAAAADVALWLRREGWLSACVDESARDASVAAGSGATP
jgi:hypothetical protein